MVKDMSSNEGVELLKEAIFKFPSALTKINNPLIDELIDYYLPYSTGIEVECNNLESFNIEDFDSIPNIMEVSCDDAEKRFRIPNGLKGLICLESICEKLTTNCSLNMGSGIHYHIDMTDVFDKVNQEFVDLNNNYVIGELVKWETAKDMNTIDAKCFYNCRGWVNFQPDFKTCEIRIGEMSFDYEVLAKRIIDANRIVRKLKESISSSVFQIRIKKLEKELEDLDLKEEGFEMSQEEIKRLIKKRNIKLYE